MSYDNISEYTKNNGKVQSDISEFEKKRQAYNKEHNTLLSYGQFELLFYLEKQRKIKEKRIKRCKNKPYKNKK